MKEGIKVKRPGWIKFYPERWIYGSTREELTNAERAVWIDFLALAYLNDPLGQIDFTSFKRLANQLNISQKLLCSTLQKAWLNHKIKITGWFADPKTGERIEECELAYDKVEAEVGVSVATQPRNGLSLYSIVIVKWNEYQSEYLRQKPYRGPEKAERNNESQGPNSVTRVTGRGEEGRKKEINEKETDLAQGDNGSENMKGPYQEKRLPSSPIKAFQEGMTTKEEFLSILRGCRGYPFDEARDSLLFDICASASQKINIIKQTRKKIEWWLEKPGCLKSDPRRQLQDWLEEEAKFVKMGGLQPIGRIIEELRSPDQREWAKKIFEVMRGGKK